MGFKAKEMRVAGFKSRELQAARYRLRDMQEGGYPWQELVIYLRAETNLAGGNVFLHVHYQTSAFDNERGRRQWLSPRSLSNFSF